MCCCADLTMNDNDVNVYMKEDFFGAMWNAFNSLNNQRHLPSLRETCALLVLLQKMGTENFDFTPDQTKRLMKDYLSAYEPIILQFVDLDRLDDNGSNS